MVAVAEHLKRLHENGIVHGDIRLLNMVFSDEKSELIDFDFSGEQGKVEYPPGYRMTVFDGRRRGKPKQLVSMTDDVAALVEALDLVVVDGLRNYLRTTKEPKIDEVIGLLKKPDRFSIQPLPDVADWLKKHTKLARSENRTGEISRLITNNWVRC